MTGQGFRETGFETRLRFLRVRANQTLGGGGDPGSLSTSKWEPSTRNKVNRLLNGLANAIPSKLETQFESGVIFTRNASMYRVPNIRSNFAFSEPG